VLLFTNTSRDVPPPAKSQYTVVPFDFNTYPATPGPYVLPPLVVGILSVFNLSVPAVKSLVPAPDTKLAAFNYPAVANTAACE
jgi:hypothetical protein